MSAYREPVGGIRWEGVDPRENFAYYAEWWEPEPLSPLVVGPPHWVSIQRALMPIRVTLNPWFALWRFEP